MRSIQSKMKMIPKFRLEIRIIRMKKSQLLIKLILPKRSKKKKITKYLKVLELKKERHHKEQMICQEITNLKS